MQVYTVTQLAEYLRAALERDPQLRDIWVSGEVSSLFESGAGHVYFNVKDAGAAVKAVLFAGNAGAEVSIRMTGCPNGCSRPYTSEIGLVGSGLHAYALFLGGNFDGTQLNRMILERVKEDDIVRVLVPVLEAFKTDRLPGERFGNFCDRIGHEMLKELVTLNGGLKHG